MMIISISGIFDYHPKVIIIIICKTSDDHPHYIHYCIRARVELEMVKRREKLKRSEVVLSQRITEKSLLFQIKEVCSLYGKLHHSIQERSKIPKEKDKEKGKKNISG